MILQQYSHHSSKLRPWLSDKTQTPLLRLLYQRFGPFPRHHIEMSVTTKVMLNLVKKMDKKRPRRSEVVMIIPNKAGRIWLIKISNPKYKTSEISKRVF